MQINEGAVEFFAVMMTIMAVVLLVFGVYATRKLAEAERRIDEARRERSGPVKP